MKLKRFDSDDINESRDYTVSKPQVEIDNPTLYPDGWKEMDGMFMNPKKEEDEKFEIIERLAQHWNEKLKTDYLVPKSLYNYSLDDLKEIEKFYIGETFLISKVEPKITKEDILKCKDLNSRNNYDWQEDILDTLVDKVNEIISKNISGEISKKDKEEIIKETTFVYNKFCTHYDEKPTKEQFKAEVENFITNGLSVWKKYNTEWKKSYESTEEACDITDKTCTICETIAELKELHMNNEAVDNIYATEDGEIVFDCKCETDIQGTTEYNGFKLNFNKLCDYNPINESVSFEEDEMTEEEIIEHARMIKESCINEYLVSIKESVIQQIKKGDNVNVTMNYFEGTPTYEVIAEKDSWSDDENIYFTYRLGGDMMMIATFDGEKWSSL